jgi:hypothetical protein
LSSIAGLEGLGALYQKYNVPLTNDYNTSVNDSKPQHEYMTDKFFTQLMDGVKHFDGNRASEVEYLSVCLEGLHLTPKGQLMQLSYALTRQPLDIINAGFLASRINVNPCN